MRNPGAENKVRKQYVAIVICDEESIWLLSLQPQPYLSDTVRPPNSEDEP
jgi:hypothetical protein